MTRSRFDMVACRPMPSEEERVVEAQKTAEANSSGLTSVPTQNRSLLVLSLLYYAAELAMA